MDYTFLRFPNFRQKALTLSYDDGVVYDEKLIEIMNWYSLKGTFNLNSGLFAEKDGERRLTKERAVKLYKNSGHEVAVHGAKHLALTSVGSEIGGLDILEDRKNLEELFGGIIKGMAYANGAFDDRVVEILKACKIKYARTTVSTESFALPQDWLRLPATCHHNNPKLMELADRFLEDRNSGWFWSNKPKLFYLWGHSYEFNDQNNWEVIEAFAKKVGNREDVWYATNMEIYDYVKAFESLEYSVDGKTISNPSNYDLYLYYFGQNVLVKANSVTTI